MSYSSASGAVSITGDNVHIGGTVYYGVGGSSSCISTTGSGEYIYATAALTNTDTAPILSPTTTPSTTYNASQQVANNSTLSPCTVNGNLTMGTDSGSYTYMQAGTYIVQGDLDLYGNVTPSGGAVQIYVYGKVIVEQNGRLNNDISGAFASGFQIYGQSTCTSISVQSNSVCNWAVYAPNATFTSGGYNNMAGAVTAASCSLGYSDQSFYDPDLARDFSYYSSVLSRW